MSEIAGELQAKLAESKPKENVNKMQNRNTRGWMVGWSDGRHGGEDSNWTTVTNVNDAKTEKLYKAFRGILNKLTPQKFSVLVTQALDLEIGSEDRLKGCVNIIFEKAIDEPEFSEAYANMCKHLCLIKVTSKDGYVKYARISSNDVYFRKILLNRCQKEFEAGALLETNFEEEAKRIVLIVDEKERAEAEEAHKSERARAKRRYLGNIRFIGELFELKMLTEPIMHDSICKLLSKKDEKQPDKHDEESLEWLCRLLSSIGKDLDHVKSKPKIDSYFREIERIIENKKTATARVRFMLMDVVELRKSQWIPRRDDNAPKTIDQIHKDAEREEQEMLANIVNKIQNRNMRGGTPAGGRQGGEDSGRQTDVKGPKIDPYEFKLSKPGGRPGGWNCGSNLVSGVRWRGSSPCRGSPPPPPQRASLEAAKPSTKPPPSDDVIEKKVKSLVEELISVQDFKESVACVKELNAAEKMPFVVETILMHVLERSSIERKISGRFCLDLVREGLMTPEQFVEGSSTVLENAEDFLVDIPRLWEYLGEFYGGLISSRGLFPLKHFAKFCGTLRRYAGKFLAATLKCAEKSLGQQTLATCWQTAALSLDDLIGDGANDFLGSNDLCFLVANASNASSSSYSSTINSANIPSSSSSSSSSLSASSHVPFVMSQFSKELENRLRQKSSDDDDIKMWINILWIHDQVGDAMVKDPAFIRALMTAAASIAVSGEGKMAVYKSTELRRHSELLQHFFNEDVNFEIQAVYALQSFVNGLKHPPGVLQQIFDTCYDDDVISEQAFRAWNDSTDHEEDGKGIAKLSVVNFFKWLSEAESEWESEDDKGECDQ